MNLEIERGGGVCLFSQQRSIGTVVGFSQVQVQVFPLYFTKLCATYSFAIQRHSSHTASFAKKIFNSVWDIFLRTECGGRILIGTKTPGGILQNSTKLCFKQKQKKLYLNACIQYSPQFITSVVSCLLNLEHL